MQRLTAFALAAALVLPGCGAHFGARNDSPSAAGTASTGATRDGASSDVLEYRSPWADDPYFIAPPA